MIVLWGFLGPNKDEYNIYCGKTVVTTGITALTVCVRLIVVISLNIAYFSKTGIRNMAETCAVDFSYPASYSTSLVLGCLRALLLPVPTWERWDLRKFRGRPASGYFSQVSSPV